MAGKRTYQEMQSELEKQHSEILEDGAAEAKEKHEFLMAMCKEIMITGGMNCGDDLELRVKVCCLLIEIMEHYKTFIDLSVAQEKDK